MIPAGVLAGFMQVAVFSWIQQRVPRAMPGLAMSIFLGAALAAWLGTHGRHIVGMPSAP